MSAKVSWCQEWMTRSGEAMNLAKQMQLGFQSSYEGWLKLSPKAHERGGESDRCLPGLLCRPSLSSFKKALKHKWFTKQVPRRRLAAVDQARLHLKEGFVESPRRTCIVSGASGS